MNISHLKYFIDAARLNSVSKSADLNRVSHSAVSQAIKSLEQSFGANLIYHSRRQFQLTPQGEQCLEEGQKILSIVELTKENLQKSRSEVQGELTIWAPQSLVVESLYRALEAYRVKYPKVRIKLMPGAAALVRSAVTAGDVHIGILVDDGFASNFESVVVRKGSFILVGNKKAPNLEKNRFLITSIDKVEVAHLRKNYRSKFKKELDVEMEVMSWGVVKNLAQKGFGIGYVPDYCVDHELSKGELFKMATPWSPFQYSIKAIWPKNRHLHSNAKLFLELLKAEAQR